MLVGEVPETVAGRCRGRTAARRRTDYRYVHTAGARPGEIRPAVRFVTGRLDDPAVWDAVVPYVQAAAMRQRLNGMRIVLTARRRDGRLPGHVLDGLRCLARA